MLINSKRIFFYTSLILSIVLTANEKPDKVIQDKILHTDQSEVERSIQKFLKDNLEQTHKELLQQSKNVEDLFYKIKDQSEQTVEGFLNSDMVLNCKNQLNKLSNKESINIRLDKICLGTAVLGILCILAMNKITQPGVIRNSLGFKTALGVGSGFLIYELVATNGAVKKDIYKLVARFKKD